MNNYLSGIDVSHYQGTVNWNAVKAAGIQFAFAKATEGSSNVDQQFSANWQGMAAAGLVRGTYHFFETNVDPVAQATHFLATLQAAGGLQSGDIAPVVDIEAMSGSFNNQTLSNNLQAWLDQVAQSLGRTPIIYTSSGFWNSNMNAQFGTYPLWIANYGVSQPTLPTGWRSWTYWQYSQSGSVAGVNGAVDCDYFAGDVSQL